MTKLGVEKRTCLETVVAPVPKESKKTQDRSATLILLASVQDERRLTRGPSRWSMDHTWGHTCSDEGGLGDTAVAGVVHVQDDLVAQRTDSFLTVLPGELDSPSQRVSGAHVNLHIAPPYDESTANIPYHGGANGCNPLHIPYRPRTHRKTRGFNSEGSNPLTVSGAISEPLCRKVSLILR